ncbi:MAG: PQQ-binding-like beta-propeller repeat protein [Ghiorsea sp.]|nr:PQQ-binding-like beta-propeller repeat protein [Ghiorsea sp.]
MMLLRGFVAACCMLMLASAVHANETTRLHIAWSVDVDQRLPNTPLALSTPAVITTGGQSYIVLGAQDGWVHVYDMDGADVRRIRIQAPSDSGVLALSNGLVVLGDTAGLLYGVDPVKGTIQWQTQLTAGLTSAPVAIGDDFLVQTADNRVYRFSAKGEKQWSFSGQNNTFGMYINASPLVLDSQVYVLLSNGDAVALKAGNGDVLWKQQLLLSSDSASLSELKVPLSHPVFLPQLHLGGEKNDNVLLAPLFQGDLQVISVADGSLLLSLPVSLKSTPVLKGRLLYMADSTGYVHVYDIKKGSRLWSKKVSDTGLLGPVLWQDTLWLVDNQGAVYQLSRQGEVKAMTRLSGHVSREPLLTSHGLLIRTERGEMMMVRP